MIEVQQLINAIATQTQLSLPSVSATVELLTQGCTVPFIARYRKGQTRGLDEVQIRSIQSSYQYFQALFQRKETILKSIEAQGKLDEKLSQLIEQCMDINELEDLYLPFKPKRKTKATLAAEQGLSPLAEIIQTCLTGDKEVIIKPFLQGDICTRKEAIQGAQYIIAEKIAEQAPIRAHMRKHFLESGVVSSSARKTDHQDAHKFELYHNFSVAVAEIKPYQLLALNRASNLGILSVTIDADLAAVESFIIKTLAINDRLLFYDEYIGGIRLALTRYLAPALEREVRKILTEAAELHAAGIFAANLRGLLMQPPLANEIVLGIDPGFASGCKLAVVNTEGKYLAGGVMYPTPPHNLVAQAEKILVDLIQQHGVTVVAIGNGTAGRETEQFVAQTLRKYKPAAKYLIVNEAGASVYSASEIGRKEFPQLDAAERGNISIARRVLDPLAELVKIDPKSIGVGLYQHDVDPKLLDQELGAVVESCVNEVGIDLNTASARLLSFVSGLNERLATAIVAYREAHGRFQNREELKKIKGIGEKVYEQCAGFLRIRNGNQPLDNTSIHPESYEKVAALAQYFEISPTAYHQLSDKLKALDNKKLAAVLSTTGLDKPTFELICQNLASPGRDPRADIPAPILRSDILRIEDLKAGMHLRGTVRNVVDFGAFVDIGIKNDALLHISKMHHNGRRVHNPLDIVQVGDVIEVKIDKIEVEKQRVSLAMV
jgi:uncharacterized protein